MGSSSRTVKAVTEGCWSGSAHRPSIPGARDGILRARRPSRRAWERNEGNEPGDDFDVKDRPPSSCGGMRGWTGCAFAGDDVWPPKSDEWVFGFPRGLRSARAPKETKTDGDAAFRWQRGLCAPPPPSPCLVVRGRVVKVGVARRPAEDRLRECTVGSEGTGARRRSGGATLGSRPVCEAHKWGQKSCVIYGRLKTQEKK